VAKTFSSDSSASILDKPFEFSRTASPENSLEEQGNTLWDSLDGPLEFAGQAAWGFTEAATLGAATIVDFAKEEMAKQEIKDGTLDSSQLEGSTRYLEKKVTSFGGKVDDSAEAFGDLSLWGQSGYTLGSILGTIPTFMFGGALTSKAITGASKIGGIGQKLVTNKVSKEIKEAYGKKIATTASDDIGRVAFGDDEFKTLAEVGLREVGKDAKAAEFKQFGNEAFEFSAKEEIGRGITAMETGLPELKIVDLSEEVFKIVTRNNPDDAQRILFGFGSTAFPNMPKTGLVAGAMGYDAILGLTIGAMRGAATESIKAKMQYDVPDMVEETYADRIIAGALHEAAVLSVIGPVKFIRGGSQGSMLKKTKEAIFGVVKNLKPARNMSGPELETAVDMMNQIAGAEITKKLGPKVMKKFAGHTTGKNWWANKKEDKLGRDEMRYWINTARKDFVLNAPALWLKEFGAEMAYSLPRMAMGTVAMNASGIYEVVRHHGVENIAAAFGESPEERISNIFTAMYFTRKPHSFHTGDKMMGFETGDIRQNASLKGDMLNKTIGSLKAMSSIDIESLNNYVGGAAKNYVNENLSNHVIENSIELNTLRDLSKNHAAVVKTRNAGESVSGFSDAASKYNIENFRNEPNKLDAFRKDILKASAIMEYYKEASFTGDSLRDQTFTPKEAGDIVNEITKLQFGGKHIDPHNPFKSLNEWHEENIMNSTIDPLNNIQQFVKTSLTAILGGESTGSVVERNGVLEIPRIEGLSLLVEGRGDVSKDALHSLNTAIQSLKTLGKIRETGDLKVNLGATTQEAREIVLTNYNQIVSSLHKWVYGRDFVVGEGNSRVDRDIVTNYAWYEPYLRIKENSQIKNAVSVLKGTNEGTLTKSEREPLLEEISTVISNKSEIKLKPAAGMETTSKDYAKVNDFMQNLHRYYSDVNKKGTDNTEIDFNNAATLMSNVEKHLGTVFTNYNSKGRLSTGLLETTLKGIDLSRVSSPHNMKVAFRDLTQSEPFKETGRVILPSIKDFRDKVDAEGLSKESAAETKEFYSDLVNIVERVNPNTITISKDGISENGKSIWYSEIKKIQTNANLHYFNSARDKVANVTGGLENIQSRIKLIQLEKNYLLSEEANVRNDAKIIAEIKESISVFGEGVRDIEQMIMDIKAAHQGTNRSLLHAAIKHESSLENILKSVESMDLSKEGRIPELFKNLALEFGKMRQDAIKNGYKERLVTDMINDEIDRIKTPNRDYENEITRVTISQFALKYGIKQDDIIDLTALDFNRKQQGEDVRNRFRQMQSSVKMSEKAKAELDTLIGKIQNGDLATKDFRKSIVEPLYRITLARAKDLERNQNRKFDREDMLADLNTILTAATSSRPVMEYQYSAGRLIANTKLVGNTKDQERGFSGVMDYLSPGREDVVLLSNTNYSKDGNKLVNNFPDYFKQELRLNIDGRNSIVVESKNALRDAVFNAETTGVIRPPDARFKMVELDESTVVLARVDAASPIYGQIKYQFNDKTSPLRKKIDALGIEETGLLKDFMQTIESSSKVIKDADVESAILITRAILDAPHVFQKSTAGFLGEALTTYDPAAMNKLWKYLKIAEPKNGYIGSEENLARSNAQLEFLKSVSGSGSHYDYLYERAKDWVAPDANGKYRKLKVLSISDETAFGEGFRNVFSSRGRAEAILNKKESTGEISKEQRDYNLDLIDKMKKSVADGEFLLSESAYISQLAMQGSGGKKFITFDNKGNVSSIKAGGIKPSISYSKVNTTPGKNYGRTRVFYAKTAFKHRPEFETLLNTLKVDAITFKSANKINQYKKSKGSEWLNDDVDALRRDGSQSEQTTYANVKRLKKSSDELNLNLVDWMSQGGNLVYHKGDIKNHITELPLSSINLFAVGINHKPMVASSLGVHMQHDNGISEWINLRNRISSTEQVFQSKQNNSLYTTALAVKILKGSNSTGDPGFANSGLDQVIKHDGLITDEWMQRAIDEKTISFMLNGGAIAGAKVEHGSYDVMSADFSGMGGGSRDRLAIPVRDIIKVGDVLESSFGGARKVVSQFGEFLPSYDFSQQKFKMFGSATQKKKGVKDGESQGVGGAIIMRTDYKMMSEGNGGKRKNVDGFMMPDATNKNNILIVEGMGIDKNGRFIDLNWINNEKHIEVTQQKDMDFNKIAYEKFEKIHNEILELNSKDNRGDNFHQMMKKVHEYNVDKGTDAAIGALNSRQPRNQAGDIVINRLKSYIDMNGEIITSHGKKEGSLSSQNFIDAIHAQDADFDMDKSMVFGASHRKFWSEAGRLAGYESTADVNLIGDMFTSYATDAANASMINWGPDTHKSTLNSIDAARGRFVKMHQTMTYMANIFRSSSDKSGSTKIMSFSVAEGRNQKVKYDVRINPFNANYINTTEAIGSAVKRFIDMYKEPPTNFNENIKNLQYDLYFGNGKDRNGLFQVGKVNEGVFTEVKGFDIKSYGLKETILENFLQPINKYLTYNKGLSVDEASVPRTATLDDYHGAFRNMLFATNTNFVKSRYNDPKLQTEFSNIDITNGLQKMNAYFGSDKTSGVSMHPYDVAMRGIYKIKQDSSSRNDLLADNQAMIKYIEEGKGYGNKSLDQTLEHINKKAFMEIVSDDAKIIQYKNLASVISSLQWKMDNLTGRGDNKGLIKESAQYMALEAKRDRAIQLRQVAEAALGYKINPDENFMKLNTNKEKFFREKEFTNNYKRPIVIRDSSTDKNIKEVIAVGRKNMKPIGKNDTMLLNGKRYEVVNDETHLALEVSNSLFNTSGGWIHRDVGGKETFVSAMEARELGAMVRDFNTSVKDAWNNRLDGTKQSIAEYSMKRLDLLNTLFSSEKVAQNPAYQEALVAIMMTPGVDSNVISIAPYSSNMGGGAKLGVKFYENKNSKLMFSYLSQLSNGSIKSAPMTSTAADKILKDFITLKKLGMYSKQNGIDVHIDSRRSLAPEADLLNGHIKKDNSIGIDVFKQLRQGNENAKKAASILIDYSNGERSVDSATMYKASKVLEAAGIPKNRQFINTKYDESTNTNIGVVKRYEATIDRNKKQNLGEDGNINQGVTDYVKKSLSCFK